MGSRRAGSYDGEVGEASVFIWGRKIDSKTAQQLSISGQMAQDKRFEIRASRALDHAAALAAAFAHQETEEEKTVIEIEHTEENYTLRLVFLPGR
ncbi:hypothetical protein AJ80_01733 [Polytolypa hystricis UAMH7299]|uniref:Uncharacterized protein n=1 Tax=Polytolypa hystricis (strain UAMH7299) TaxID=1447883 RepID=A0A2B7YRG3_POLH7|nr:hypothetical protein AJ80_01733 [Polytolypa hystricis UAMH7299]